jgi:hypothetical protein
MASGRDEAGKLAAEYFSQLGEAGETEIYLPSAPGRADAPEAHSTEKTSDAAATPETPAVPATPEAPVVPAAPEVPAVEIVRVRLAFSSEATTVGGRSHERGLRRRQPERAPDVHRRGARS